MTSPVADWNDDQCLLDDLTAALRAVAPLAGTIAEHGRGALSWSSVDDELMLACLSFDSRREPVDLVRSESTSGRILVFTAEEISMEMELRPGGIVGQVIPPGPAWVRLEGADGSVRRAAADDLGCFALRAIPDGPVRLRCETAAGCLVTGWVEV